MKWYVAYLLAIAISAVLVVIVIVHAPLIDGVVV